MKRVSSLTRCTGFFRRLARDNSGNALMIIAASLLPLLAMVGGGLDIGRGYLVQARLQQACDSGVLAARKRLGTEAAIDGTMPQDTADVGDLFFKTNFKNASYGTTTRDFQMVLENDYSISGTATARMPTTLMGIFGQDYLDVAATCSAQLNMANTDIMMVLDVTGSMALTNPGDSDSRIDVLKTTVRNFYDQLAAAANATSRVRFGFLPYSTNVNVGADLKDEWVLTSWDYQSRKAISTGNEEYSYTYNRNWQHTSGTSTEAVTYSTYPATFHEGEVGEVYVDENENVVVSGGEDYYTCDTSAPSNTYTWNSTLISTESVPYAGPPEGTQEIEYREALENGRRYWVSRDGETCYIKYRDYDNKVHTYERVTEPREKELFKWQYKQFNYDVSGWRSFGHGCIEERDTYIIDDYDNVDLTKALDLDIDLVPNNDASRWRPMHRDVVFARDKKYDDTGSFSRTPTVTEDEFISPTVIGAAACPPAARKLGVMSATEIDNYLATLNPAGATYHDIGMIWGGRYLSPTGLFATENADVSVAQPTKRHMIFLTDGETETRDIAYSAYGIEPIDERRWKESSSLTLTETVENRFTIACNEVQKRGVTVWIIGFGTELNQIMKDCAGEGHYFEAADSAELNVTFAAIAKSLAELRITK